MNPYLIVLDFDGTAAKTFIDSPHRINVNTAYSLAVEELFGRAGLELYLTEGGHRNRAPTEIVQSLLGKGCESQLPLSQYELTEQLIRLKLASLLGEIGPEWPRPCDGFFDFWRVLGDLRSAGIDIRTAIISSGHDQFIRRTFNAWGIPLPNYLVTEDDIRPIKNPHDPERRFKPGCLPLAIAHRRWLVDTKGDGYSTSDAALSKHFMVYFGDDIGKDGGLATRAGLPFGLFKEGASHERLPNGFAFGHWNTIATSLRNNSQAMFEGRPFSEIFWRRLVTMEGNGSYRERMR